MGRVMFILPVQTLAILFLAPRLNFGNANKAVRGTYPRWRLEGSLKISHTLSGSIDAECALYFRCCGDNQPRRL